MKIRTKLLLLAVVSQGIIMLAVGVYFLIMAPIGTLEAENTYFQEAARRARDVQVEMNKLSSVGMDTQSPFFDKAVADYYKAVENVAGLKVLPTINESMKSAVDAVGALGALSAASLDSVKSSIADVKADIAKLGAASTDLDVVSVINRSVAPELEARQVMLLRYNVNNLLNNLRQCNESLAMTVKVIEEKDGIVAGEIRTIKDSSSITALAILVLVLAGVLGASLGMARNITKAMRLISSTVEVMSTGDLTHRFNLRRKDEIGLLGSDLDKLLESMNESLGKIKEASSMNAVMREDLLKISAEAGGSAVEIEANTDSIRSQMVRMDRMIEGAVGEIGAMVGAIKGFHERLGMQNQHVSETVAAVTQMLASIENIDRITARDRQSAENLVAESEQGKEVFDNAFEKVAEITESVSAIQEMASVIAGIANQTNILAMNAAIEAAHAGEFGKGFAVVADEIGKLATASAQSSDEIAHTIAAIVVRMNEAGATRETTTQAFNNISQQIREVSESIAEIYSNVNEMQMGSKQILSAMENLRATSTQITNESAQIEHTTQSIGVTMNDLGRISREVTSNIGEIATGVQLISKNVREVSAHSEKMGSLGSDLDAAVAVFITHAGEIAAEHQAAERA